jgi:hypothetical protein
MPPSPPTHQEAHVKRLLIVTVGVLLQSFGMPAQAQNSDFVTVNVYIDNVQQPKSVLDVSRDCSNSVGCVAFMKAVDSFFQVPASRVVAVAGQLASDTKGEGKHVTASLPAGYAYCKSSMRMVSIVPRDGDRGALFFGQSKAEALYYETWTPTRGPFNGRSWVEAGISILGIRQSMASAAYADGSCYRPDRVLWYCRGGGCADTEDRGQAKEAASPPGAGSAK